MREVTSFAVTFYVRAGKRSRHEAHVASLRGKAKEKEREADGGRESGEMENGERGKGETEMERQRKRERERWGKSEKVRGKVSVML